MSGQCSTRRPCDCCLFCPHCGVSNDLHDGPDTCSIAESKADMLSRFMTLGSAR